MLECHSGNVVGMTFEGQDWIRIRGFDVIKSNDMAACCCKESLVGGNCQAIDL